MTRDEVIALRRLLPAEFVLTGGPLPLNPIVTWHVRTETDWQDWLAFVAPSFTWTVR